MDLNLGIAMTYHSDINICEAAKQFSVSKATFGYIVVRQNRSHSAWKKEHV